MKTGNNNNPNYNKNKIKPNTSDEVHKEKVDMPPEFTTRPILGTQQNNVKIR